MSGRLTDSDSKRFSPDAGTRFDNFDNFDRRKLRLIDNKCFSIISLFIRIDVTDVNVSGTFC